jgi:O-antigen ligase
LTGCVLVIALLFGGGTSQGLWSDAAVQLASLPLLVVAVWGLLRGRAGPRSAWIVLLLFIALVLPVLQLVPMPPDWWNQLPGRGPIAAAYADIGIALPWLPLSLTPSATERSLLSLLPAAAIFLAIIQIGHAHRRRLILLVMAFVLADAVIGVLQMMNGPTSRLYFYEVTNSESAVGFFANRNHNAALLYCAIPLAAAWGLGLSRAHRGRRIAGLFLVGLVVIAAVASLAITSSRTGIALGLVAGLACIVLAAAHRGPRRRTRVLIAVGGNVLALLLAFQFGFAALAERLEHSDVIDDIRWPVAKVTIDAAKIYSPAGTGFGSFVPIFQSEEPLTLLNTFYINHAHDDWLELWLDGGLPAVTLAAAFVLWFLVAGVRAWRGRRLSSDAASLSRAASVVILLLLLHSALDYPLRTTALMVLFGLCGGMLIAPRDAIVASSERERAAYGLALQPAGLS